MNELFNKLNIHLGWGNPENAIWFVGIEEAGEWTKKEFKVLKEIKNGTNILNEYTTDEYLTDVEKYIDEHYVTINSKNSYSYFGNWEYYNSCSVFYDNISKICSRLNGLNNWQLFKYHYLCREQKTPFKFNTFITNLYPLGFNNISVWDEVIDDYRLIFGLEEIKSKNAFYDYVKEKTIRFNNINELWNQSKPIATICMGTTYSDDFLDCFEKERDINYWNKYKESKYSYYLNKNFFIVNHLSNNYYFNLFLNENIDQIMGILSDFDMN